MQADAGQKPVPHMPKTQKNGSGFGSGGAVNGVDLFIYAGKRVERGTGPEAVPYASYLVINIHIIAYYPKVYMVATIREGILCILYRWCLLYDTYM